MTLGKSVVSPHAEFLKEHEQSQTEDVYGINSLGESLRFLLSGFGGRQVLLMVWHPSVLKARIFVFSETFETVISLSPLFMK